LTHVGLWGIPNGSQEKSGLELFETPDAKKGRDFIEVAIPFSDPVADCGPRYVAACHLKRFRANTRRYDTCLAQLGELAKGFLKPHSLMS